MVVLTLALVVCALVPSGWTIYLVTFPSHGKVAQTLNNRWRRQLLAQACLVILRGYKNVQDLMSFRSHTQLFRDYCHQVRAGLETSGGHGS